MKRKLDLLACWKDREIGAAVYKNLYQIVSKDKRNRVSVNWASDFFGLCGDEKLYVDEIAARDNRLERIVSKCISNVVIMACALEGIDVRKFWCKCKQVDEFNERVRKWQLKRDSDHRYYRSKKIKNNMDMNSGYDDF